MSAITLTHPTAGPGQTPLVLELPDQLDWPDEFGWDPVVQSADYTTDGSLVLDAWAKKTGRPITLAGAEDRAWCKRSVLLTLRSWASQPGLVMTLQLRGQNHPVVFDHANRAIEADSIEGWIDPEPDDVYVLTVRFLEVLP